MKNTFKESQSQWSEALLPQLFMFCLTSLMCSFAVYLLGGNRLDIAMSPVATACVMLAWHYAKIDAAEEIIGILKYCNLIRIKVRCVSAGWKIDDAQADLRLAEIRLGCSTK